MGIRKPRHDGLDHGPSTIHRYYYYLYSFFQIEQQQQQGKNTPCVSEQNETTSPTC